MDHPAPSGKILKRGNQAVTGQKKTLKDMLIAIENLQTVMDHMDDWTLEVMAEEFDSIAEIDKKTDAIIGFMERVKNESAAMEIKAEAYRAKAKSYSNAYDRCREYCKYLLNRFPNLEFRGTNGKLTLQKNAPSLVIATSKESFSSSNVIPSDYVSLVPEQFRTSKVIWLYETDKIKDELKAGKDVPFAKLESNQSVRVKL